MGRAQDCHRTRDEECPSGLEESIVEGRWGGAKGRPVVEQAEPVLPLAATVRYDVPTDSGQQRPFTRWQCHGGFGRH